MGGLWFKVKRRFEMTKKTFKDDLRFSKRLAVYRMIDDLAWRLHIKLVAKYFHKKKDEFVLNYLKKELKFVIEKYKEDSFTGEYVENAPIWVCWWTGEDTAPILVQQCIKSIRKHAGKHPVKLVTKDNYKEYLDIPECIIEKVNSGDMCIANFSDYLRVGLIEKYGGLWLDATIFCSQQIPEEYFEMPLFTCKSELVESRYISNYRWTSFCLAGWKQHVFYRFFKEAMEEYWKQEKYSIDYLLVDYLIETGYENVRVIKDAFDRVPVNNPYRDDLQAAMNEALEANKFDGVLKEDTVLYKLSWREQYAEATGDGRESIYKLFLEQ